MLKRFLCAVLLLGITGGYPAWSQSGDAPKKLSLPRFDVRELMAREAPASNKHAQSGAVLARRTASMETFAAAQERDYAGTRIVSNREGLPKLLFRDGKPLTAASTKEPEEIAKSFLRDHAAIFPLAPAEVDRLRLVVKDTTGDATFLAFNQTLGGIDVFNGQIKFTLSKRGEVIQAGAANVVPELSPPTRPRLSAERAVRAAFDSIRGKAPAALSPVAGPEGKTAFRNPRGERYSPITAELSIFPMTATSARLAYRIFLEADPESWYEILIDAENGRLLFRQNLYVSAGQARVWTQSPMQGERQLVALAGTSADPWLPAAATVTTGNNVDAYIDATGDGKPDAINTADMQNGRAFSSSQVFDFPFGDGTVGLNPRDYKPASVTNLFYFVNVAHDYFYSLGFNEAAGNFQTDNLGRGGLGNDAILAAGQSKGRTNNATFASTPDGTAPRMRVGLFTRGTSTTLDDLDGDYDGQTIIHEYGHGVSSRLVGGRTSTSCLGGVQSGALGEGWSDYFSSSFFNNPVQGAYTSQNAIRGSRRQSYEGYTLTYEDIGNSDMGYEAHNDGEIWAATLWDLRKSLGRTVSDQLVINGLKATPCEPSMTDARDAILSADQATNGGANRGKIWQVFARHGLGYSAYGLDGGLVEGTRYDAAFDLPPDMQTTRNPAVTSNPLSIKIGMGDLYSYKVTASNPGGGVLYYALTQGPAGMTIDSANGLVSWTANFFGQRVKITVTDGRGGKVVHGYLLPVVTTLNAGAPVTISGAKGSAGLAGVAVPANVPVLQITLRCASAQCAGDADLLVLDPDGNANYSGRDGSNETLSFASPKAGRWYIGVSGFAAYSDVILAATLITPPALSANATLSGLNDVAGSERLYRVTIPAGANAFTVTTSGGTGDVDIYVRKGQPALCQASFAVSTECFSDYDSATADNAETINVIKPSAGDWYLDVSGYEAYSGVTLITYTTMAMNITTPIFLLSGSAGATYSQSLTASGGAPPYTWSITSGALPAGLTLSSAGVIAGTPTAAGNYSFTVRVTDSAAASGAQTFSLTVLGAGSLVRAGTLSHIAAGGDWVTTISLINTSLAPVSTRLVFHADNGSILSLPLSVKQQGITQSVTTATLDRVIGPHTTLVIEAGSPSAALAVGWADVLSTGPVSGFAIFRSKCPTCAASEGTVPLQSRFQSTLIVPYDNTANFVTGVALANLSAAPVSITATIWDENGAQLGTPTITLAGGGHTALVMPTGLPLTAGKRGIVQFQNSAGGALDGLGLRFSPFGTFTSVPTMLQTVTAAGPLARAGTLSHIAAGGDWVTTISLINTSSAPVTARLVFHADDGGALSLPLSVTQQGDTQSVTAATLERVINPHTTLVIDAGTQLTTLAAGWADVLSTGPVSGFAIFRSKCPTCAASEGTVPLQSRFQSTLIVPYDNAASFVTGVALANLSAAQASTTATIWDENGSQLGAPAVTVAGSGHTALVMPTGLPLTAGKRGIVQFQNSAAGGSLDGLGLRFSPFGTFTSVPTIQP